MGKNRDMYFQKYCRYAQTPEDYIRALAVSPYRTHRRMAELLIPELDKLIEQRTQEIEDQKRKEELASFEEKLKI